MKLFTLLTLGALLFSCGQNQQDSKKQNLKGGNHTYGLTSREDLRAVIIGEKNSYELKVKEYDQLKGEIKFENLSEFEILEVINEKKISLEFFGLDTLMFDNYEISNSKLNFSNLKTISEEHTVNLKGAEIKKFLSVGAKINIEEVVFKVKDVEIKKEFSHSEIDQTGAFNSKEELKDSQAIRYIERFFLAKKTPKYDEFKKVGKVKEFRISVNLFPLKMANEGQSVELTVKQLSGYEFIECNEEIENLFEVTSIEKPHLKYKIKNNLRELRTNTIYSPEIAKTKQTIYELSHRVPDGYYLEYSDGTGTLVFDSIYIEYLNEYEVRREIIPLYY